MAVVGLMIAGLGGGLSVACKRSSSVEKDMAARLAGTWLWRQSQIAQPTVIVLDLTAKGRFTETTYRETGGQLRILYIKRATNDLVPEPASPEEIVKLKKSGFEPAVESGRFRIAVAEKTQSIVFESDKLSKIEKSEGRGVNQQPLVINAADRVTIGGRIYQRQAVALHTK
jgi:hypothetical protein